MTCQCRRRASVLAPSGVDRCARRARDRSAAGWSRPGGRPAGHDRVRRHRRRFSHCLIASRIASMRLTGGSLAATAASSWLSRLGGIRTPTTTPASGLGGRPVRGRSPRAAASSLGATAADPVQMPPDGPRGAQRASSGPWRYEFRRSEACGSSAHIRRTWLGAKAGRCARRGRRRGGGRRWPAACFRPPGARAPARPRPARPDRARVACRARSTSRQP